MAHMTAEKAKLIRQALKAQFPSCKFSVRKEGNLSINVSIMKSPFFEDGEQHMVNHYWIDQHYEDEAQASFLKTVLGIIEREGDYYDRSDVMTDYFDCAFYIHMNVGQYDKPHVRLN